MNGNYPIKVDNKGVSPEAYARNIGILSNLETIRVNQFEPFNLQVVQVGGNDTTSEILLTEQFEAGYVYVITSVSASDADDAAHQIKVGILDGVTYFVYESATVANAGDSVEYVGQLMAKETDKIFAEFRSVGASDTIKLFVNGYRIRR